MTAMQLKKDYAGRDFLSLLDYTIFWKWPII